MNLDKAQDLAVHLMYLYNLESWNFKFDHSLRRLGQCNHLTRTISLGRHATEVNTEEQVRMTCLHEIAHALVGGRHGHDEVWQAKCIQIGGDGKRLGSIAVKATPKYKISCSNCLSVYSYYRRPRFMNDLNHAWCAGKNCGKEKTTGKLVIL